MGPTAQALTGLTFMVGLPGPTPGGVVVLLPRPRRRLPRRRRHPGRRSSTGAAPARASTSTCPSSSRPPPCPARSSSTPSVNDRPAAAPTSRPATGAPTPRAPPRARTGPTGDDKWVVVSCRDRGPVGGVRRGHGPARRGPPTPGSPPWPGASSTPTTSTPWSRRGRRTRDRYEVMDLLQARRGARPGRCRTRPTGSSATRSWRPGGTTPCSATPRWARCRSRACPSACRPRRRTPAGALAPWAALSRRGQRRRPGRAARDEPDDGRRAARPTEPCRDRACRGARRGARPRARRRVGRVLRAAAGRARRRRGQGRAARRRAVAPHRARSSTTSPVPTAASPSGPTTWASARSWSTTTPSCWRCATAADVLVHTLAPGRGRAPGGSTTPRWPSGHPGLIVVRDHAVRVRRALGRLPRRRPRAHGARRVDGGLRVRPGPTAPTTLPRWPAGRPGLAHGGDLRGHRRAGRARPGAGAGAGQLIDVSAHQARRR